MSEKEAKSRIKINRLLEKAGWRFFDHKDKKANVRLEKNVKITRADIDAFGKNFETVKNGYVDFLLTDENGFPILVLEAKKKEKNPLEAKEQARKYANSIKVRFIILSNGDYHYFWDLEQGNPEIIIEFPTLESLMRRQTFITDKKRLAKESVDQNYIAVTQNPNFKNDPKYKNLKTRDKYLFDEKLKILRPYQLEAIYALQKSANKNQERFLFEMATGTGKTLIASAIIKLFLRTGNAKRILFLVDRLELEEQAYKSFVNYLKNDYTSVIYKKNRDDWNKAEIVISTIQSLSAGNKYKNLFSPADFDLIISDEAHRTIGGNSRAVFEYFIGYKLGLTATPKNYLKNINPKNLSEKDPRSWERRQLLDTYKTFGCENGDPTFRYGLIKGVKEDYLISPILVDARTKITTKLLSDKGYAAILENGEEEEAENTFFGRDFEKKFFSQKTNKVFCSAFLKNALKDPISDEIGKSVIFCVSQKHALKITEILNKLADKIFPNKYKSDFAVQVTSNVQDARRFTINFANNNLNGHTDFLENYKSSKTRVCVTVGMMTTGYDCQDILNICLMRPVFSPTDFIQIKGRGTRKFTFEYKEASEKNYKIEKTAFKFFDFFANCEYFEEKFDYDEVLKLPAIHGKESQNQDIKTYLDTINIFAPDKIKTITETPIGSEGMRIDREFFKKAKKTVRENSRIANAVKNENWEKAISIIKTQYENKPELHLNLEKIRKSKNIDRKVTWKEFLELAFGIIPAFKTKNEKLDEECDKFISIHKPNSEDIPYIRNYFKTYVGDKEFRKIIEEKRYGDLNFCSSFGIKDFKALNKEQRDTIPEYVKTYINLDTYAV